MSSAGGVVGKACGSGAGASLRPGGAVGEEERVVGLTVSVIIPALNEAKNLPACLDGLNKQECVTAGVEVIVVDNGSTDRTREIGQALGARAVIEARRGRSFARNAGIRAAGGEVLVFLDADCVPRSGWLQGVLSAFKDAAVGCAAGEIENEVLGGGLAEFMGRKGYLSQADNFAHPFLPYAATGNVAFRKTVLDRIGGFDVKLWTGQDADLCWRMQLETEYKIKLVPDAVVVHRMEVSPRSIFRQKRRHANGLVMLYKKYRMYWRPERKGLKSLYWEYRSIARRALRVGARRLREKVGMGVGSPLPFDEQQVLFELAWKVGLIEGSLRHRVLFL